MIKQYTWFPVRCCCKPETLLGFLRVRRAFNEPIGNETEVHFRDRMGKDHRGVIRRLRKPQPFNPEMLHSRPRPSELIRGEEELAVYSDDRPLVFWRTIPDFIEAGAADTPTEIRRKHLMQMIDEVLSQPGLIHASEVFAFLREKLKEVNNA